jgi:thiol-disulfide isomerase/thioredoxin
MKLASRTATIAFMGLVAASYVAGETVPTLAIGSPAPDFHLPGIDGKMHSLADYNSAKILVVVFTCDHCPTAQLYEGRIKQLVEDYKDKGVALVAIQPNDPKAVRLDEMGYTDVGDSLEEMKIRAAYRHFNFPYLYDGATQSVARAYGPVSTPHVFIFDAQRKLRYQGRVDSSMRENLARIHDARDAIDTLLAGKPVANPVRPTMGCSIKWSTKGGQAEELLRINAQPVKLDMASAANLSTLRKNTSGKVVLVDFWTTWCGPCVEEFPEFEKMYRMYGKRAFDLVTVAAQFPDERKGVFAFLERQHATSRNLLFSEDDTYAMMAAFDSKWNGGVPYTVLLGPGGVVLFSSQGATDPLELRRLILRHLPDDDYIGQQAYWSSH